MEAGGFETQKVHKQTPNKTYTETHHNHLRMQQEALADTVTQNRKTPLPNTVPTVFCVQSVLYACTPVRVTPTWPKL